MLTLFVEPVGGTRINTALNQFIKPYKYRKCPLEEKMILFQCLSCVSQKIQVL